MISINEAKSFLKSALKKEKQAEEHCKKILNFAYLNGFTGVITRIKNDEARHQIIVKELIDLLDEA